MCSLDVGEDFTEPDGGSGRTKGKVRARGWEPGSAHSVMPHFFFPVFNFPRPHFYP